MTALSIIIPANNEADYIGTCLKALMNQEIDLSVTTTAEIIVAANACTDRTVAISETYRGDLEKVGWVVKILDIDKGGKLNALNIAEAQASGRVLVYLDADVICSPKLMRRLLDVLDTTSPRYASGRLEVSPPKTWVTKRFSKVWVELPFMKTNVQGAGLFAVNRSGRERWGDFPDIIADDGFVRLMFAPDERIKVDAAYQWPLVEGFRKLSRVRRRQDAGVRQLEEKFPDLVRNESKPRMTLAKHFDIFARMPVSYLVYSTVVLWGRWGGAQGSREWVRGR